MDALAVIVKRDSKQTATDTFSKYVIYSKDANLKKVLERSGAGKGGRLFMDCPVLGITALANSWGYSSAAPTA